MSPDGEACQNSPALLRRQLDIELRRLRQTAGLTIGAVASTLHCSSSKVSRIEKARVRATIRDVRDLLDIYHVDSREREVLLDLAQGARQRDPRWYAYAYGEAPPDHRTFRALEEAAEIIRT